MGHHDWLLPFEAVFHLPLKFVFQGFSILKAGSGAKFAHCYMFSRVHLQGESSTNQEESDQGRAFDTSEGPAKQSLFIKIVPTHQSGQNQS
jgi:hypothetical protein